MVYVNHKISGLQLSYHLEAHRLVAGESLFEFVPVKSFKYLMIGITGKV